MKLQDIALYTSVALFSTGLQAKMVTINFDELTPDTVVTNQYEGVEFSLVYESMDDNIPLFARNHQNKSFLSGGSSYDRRSKNLFGGYNVNEDLLYSIDMQQVMVIRLANPTTMFSLTTQTGSRGMSYSFFDSNKKHIKSVRAFKESDFQFNPNGPAFYTGEGKFLGNEMGRYTLNASDIAYIKVYGGGTNLSYPQLYEISYDDMEVPVPAAAWLFGTALAGLVTAKRKKK